MQVLSPSQVFLNPDQFARTFLKILDKDKRLVPLVYNKAQRHYLRGRTRRDLILKARQLGFSTMLQAELFRLVTTGSATTITLSHLDSTTQSLRRLADRYYENLPEGFRPTRKYANSTVTTYPDFDSEAVIATAGSKQGGRGLTANYIHASEVAFWTDADAIMAGAMQAGNPAIIVESTANGANGWFYNTCMEALEGRSQWKLWFFPWWQDDTYRVSLQPDETIDYMPEEKELIRLHKLDASQIKWRRIKWSELKHLAPQEYPETVQSAFLRSGLGYMGDIEHAFTAPVDATPQAGHEYYAGLDFGQQNDYTVCSVIDKTTMQQVALLRVNQLSWAEMRRRVRDVCKYWGVKVLKPETNSMGSTNIEALQDEFYADGLRTSIVPFTTTNATKTASMAALRESLHDPEGLRLLPDPAQKHEMSGLQARQTITGAWQLSAPDGEHDDIPMGNMLAFDAIQNSILIAPVRLNRRW